MPTTGQIVLLLIAIAVLLAGGTISVARIRFERPWSRLAAKVCMYVGLVVSLLVIAWHSMTRQSWLPLEDNFDTLIWLSVALTGFVLYVQRRRPIPGMDWFVMPVVVLLLCLAAVSGSLIPHEYDVSSGWSWLHRITAYGGALAFAIAGAASAMYLIANYRLRRKSTLAGPKLGSLERLERLTLHAVTLGFPLLTIGAVTGFAQMRRDPHTPPLKIALSCLTWVIYALVLHALLNPSFRGRRAAALSVVGFVMMIGTIVVVELIQNRP
jgi:ABC-type uncharacterized transport system permease subunit